MDTKINRQSLHYSRAHECFQFKYFKTKHFSRSYYHIVDQHFMLSLDFVVDLRTRKNYYILTLEF